MAVGVLLPAGEGRDTHRRLTPGQSVPWITRTRSYARPDIVSASHWLLVVLQWKDIHSTNVFPFRSASL